ncbi:MAG: hypothetical protein AAGF98_07525 [Cyanobacteria bacterium P01_H01_bin.153]
MTTLAMMLLAPILGSTSWRSPPMPLGLCQRSPGAIAFHPQPLSMKETCDRFLESRSCAQGALSIELGSFAASALPRPALQNWLGAELLSA